jgi:hypothetical protein
MPTSIRAPALFVLASLLSLSACATVPRAAGPQQQFWNGLSALCGQAFEGRVTSPPAAADADFAGKRMIMHIRQCGTDEIRIPFYVGEDRSRVWVISRTAIGLRLKHDHRHSDGSEDDLTRYGGDTAAAGTATRQEFPADQFSKDMFVRGNIPQSIANVWALEVEPGRTFAYELRRPDRHFRVEFELSRPIPPPPPPWGSR